MIQHVLAAWLLGAPGPVYRTWVRVTRRVVVCDGRRCWFERDGHAGARRRRTEN